MEYAKRRRVENDYSQFGLQQPRTASSSKARTSTSTSGQGGGSSNKASRGQSGQSSAAVGGQEDLISTPLLDLSTLPPSSLQRYLSRYELLEPTGTLSYHHAVFPVPPLPLHVTSPLVGRQLASRRSRPNYGVINHEEEQEEGEGVEGEAEGKGRKRGWKEPKTKEFAELTACDSGELVSERLANRAKKHWDKRDSVKEGETLTNFMFAVRMRAHTLRATPPG